jgi:hypothetical protein
VRSKLPFLLYFGLRHCLLNCNIADKHPVDAALISARALIELGNPKEAERYAAFAVRVAPKSIQCAPACGHRAAPFNVKVFIAPFLRSWQ